MKSLAVSKTVEPKYVSAKTTEKKLKPKAAKEKKSTDEKLQIVSSAIIELSKSAINEPVKKEIKPNTLPQPIPKPSNIPDAKKSKRIEGQSKAKKASDVTKKESPVDSAITSQKGSTPPKPKKSMDNKDVVPSIWDMVKNIFK